ncbi:Alkylated DNA repair protein alkB 8 [Boothiomyces sp. JEL0866]|nr:Alkylated DNA repair protein alkB 8 [Boothiomyces sp. JEL0866]
MKSVFIVRGVIIAIVVLTVLWLVPVTIKSEDIPTEQVQREAQKTEHKKVTIPVAKAVTPSQVAFVTFYAPQDNKEHRTHFDDKTYNDLSQYSMTNIADYCTHHGFAFFFRNNYMVDTVNKAAYWGKMDVVKHYLDAGYEWVVWTDIDVLFLSKESLLDKWLGKANSTQHMAFVTECTREEGKFGAVRSGFFAIRNSKIGRGFLDAWKDTFAEFKGNWNPEQEALEGLVQKEPWKSAAYVTPQDGIHTYLGCLHYDPNPISVHFPGFDKGSMKEYHEKHSKKKKEVYELLSRMENDSIENLVSADPTPVLIALNASYDSLITGKQLKSIFDKFRGYSKIEMFVGSKPYSYIFYDTNESAKKVFEALDCQQSDILKKTLLLAYANKLPEFPERPLTIKEEIEQLPGIYYLPNFVNLEEEEILTNHVKEQGELGRWEILHQRSVQHYGYRFDYPTNDVDRRAIDLKDELVLLPEWTSEILDRYMQKFPHHSKPNQLTMNHYIPGGGIPYHTDRHSSFLSPVLIFSMASDIVMDFKSLEEKVTSVVLERGSLVVMDGKARYEYQHAIKPRNVDIIDGLVQERTERWSLTFRTIREDEPCKCGTILCD